MATTPLRTPSDINSVDKFERDLEVNNTLSNHLTNDTVGSLSWSDVGVVVKDRKTKEPLSILSSTYGHVQAGEVLAIMGPSGSGKTTLLNALAHRVVGANAKVSGQILVNSQELNRRVLRQLSNYVEQEDFIIGSLTVRETMDFAARLALPSTISKKNRLARVDDLLDSFGLHNQAHALVGTPIRKGISGGQKRRLSVASQLITDPKILFLDEPTSGLDSVASFEVINYIKRIAYQHRIIVVASIHQPSTTTFELFDKIMLLSAGKTCYFGPVKRVDSYLASISRPLPLHINPAEFLLNLVNVDFAKNKVKSQQDLDDIHEAWNKSEECKDIKSTVLLSSKSSEKHELFDAPTSTTKLLIPLTLLHRNFIKSYRDIIAYGIRLAMYMGLAIMMGTVWLRLSNSQSSIEPFTNAIFFGCAFMSFMAVAYIPAFMEDLSTYKKEHANGLYGALPFTIANFLIGIPYLFIISLLFSIVSYWLSNFRPSTSGFFTWVVWLFLDLVAAEGLVVLITSLAPIFVVALAATAFANGLWMCVGGFMVPLPLLNVFWKYVFHYIDYQAWVFEGMMVNQFTANAFYNCAGTATTGFNCMYPSDLESQGKIRASAVLEAYNYPSVSTPQRFGIMIAIIFGYRILGYAVLRMKTN